LSNASALEKVLRIPGHQFLFTPLVASECHAACVGEIIQLSQDCDVVQLNDEQIDGELFLELIANHRLGDGETECLAVCMSRPGSLLCCDDRRARQVAEQLLGGDRVIGSLRLLKWTVSVGLATRADALALYQTMKDRGGFLPDVPIGWFEP